MLIGRIIGCESVYDTCSTFPEERVVGCYMYAFSDVQPKVLQLEKIKDVIFGEGVGYMMQTREDKPEKEYENVQGLGKQQAIFMVS